MTHFMTLAALQSFAPYLLLLVAAVLQQRRVQGVARGMVGLAAVAQALTWPVAQDELFSRHLAHDRFAAVALLAICAIALWRPATDLLACFVAACLGATNDTLSLFVLWGVLAQTRGITRAFVPWAVLGTLVALGVQQMRVTEFSTVTQMSAPVLWSVCFAVVGVALVWSRPRWVEVVAWALPLLRLIALTQPIEVSGPWVLR